MSSPVLAELQSLRQELASLSVRVLALEERLADTGSTPGTFSSPVTVNYLTGSGTGYPEVPPFPTFERTFPSPGSGQSSPPTRRSPGGVDISEAERRAAAVAAGEFLRRALSGDHRGSSGRSRIPLPSTVYVLCKDLHNRTYNPVKVFYSFSALKPLVKEGNLCKDSIFIGFPSTWEAQLAVSSAGLLWPSDGAAA